MNAIHALSQLSYSPVRFDFDYKDNRRFVKWRIGMTARFRVK